jgi:hypothetical protein
MVYYKLLNEGGVTTFGHATWALPQNGKPGKWMPRLTGKIIPCRHGYHVVRFTDLLDWCGDYLWVVETSGRVLTHYNKCVVRRARIVRPITGWNKRNLRLFAADCAEHVLPIFEKHHPKDNRPRRAIEVARLFANGKATDKKRDAAWAAARAADRDAAWDAARDAAWDAARAAARAADRDVVGAAARDAEREWQLQRLAEYLDVEYDHD